MVIFYFNNQYAVVFMDDNKVRLQTIQMGLIEYFIGIIQGALEKIEHLLLPRRWRHFEIWYFL